jgi:hypothetical protein
MSSGQLLVQGPRSAPLQFISGDVDTYSTPESEPACRLQPFSDV